ncbi:MAG: Hpt domain-containing protein [Candidatus Obscuribacterales bacterium]|nr:Hpt domain-containing protein [Candidatus Obscuribacterales bacterium]
MTDFEHLKAFCGPKELQELYKTFAEESDMLLIELSKAVSSQDQDSAKRLAHQLKGLASTLNAEDMRVLAADLEIHVKESTWSPTISLNEKLAQTVIQVKNDLKKTAFPDKL